MLTIGIHDGHTAGVCIFEDGRVIACVSEERLNRKKEWSGFPTLAIQKCLAITNKIPEDFDAVGICSYFPQTGHDGYDKPSSPKRVFSGIASIAPQSFLQKESNVSIAQRIGWVLGKSRRIRISDQLKSLGFICAHNWYEHHKLHAATAYYTNWYRPNPCLVITLDGSGDAICGTISIGENGKLTRIKSIFNYNSICEFYTRVTQYLGMKPMSHEYKVMGLAPYTGRDYSNCLLEKFRKYFMISGKDPLTFINTSGVCRWQFLALLQGVLFRERFDNICGAVQDLFEEVSLKWVSNAIKATGIRDLALSGGGFMNVKLNARILSLSDVNSLFVFPSCGDESNPIGAAILAAIDKGFDSNKIQTLSDIYWGSEFTNADVESAMSRMLSGSGFNISFHEDIDWFVGKEVATGKIVGRLRGKMEWGARALGNRSIVADPRSQKVIHRINKAIKMRDFWMPFAPAVLDRFESVYLRMKEGFRCPFMVMAFETTKKGQDEITAGIHPFDNTARAQIVNENDHLSFFRLIEGFEEATGVGGVLNTSFNLHGDPVVCSPEDAIYTFLNSDLDAMQMENYYIERMRTAEQ